MNKKKIADIYGFLTKAKLTKMDDGGKIAVIRMMRVMKPIFTEVTTCIQDAFNAAVDDNYERMAVTVNNPTATEGERAAANQYIARLNEVVRNSTADLMDAEADIDTKVLTQEQFEHLCVSNDWGLDVIEELEVLLTK